MEGAWSSIHSALCEGFGSMFLFLEVTFFDENASRHQSLRKIEFLVKNYLEVSRRGGLRGPAHYHL